jgi:hypothetical protein
MGRLCRGFGGLAKAERWRADGENEDAVVTGNQRRAVRDAASEQLDPETATG